MYSGSDGNESACNEGELGLIPGLGRSPEEGNGCPIQFSCLKIPVDRGSWRPIVHASISVEQVEECSMHPISSRDENDSQS